jgi:hypothetical protein
MQYSSVEPQLLTYRNEKRAGILLVAVQVFYSLTSYQILHHFASLINPDKQLIISTNQLALSMKYPLRGPDTGPWSCADGSSGLRGLCPSGASGGMYVRGMLNV